MKRKLICILIFLTLISISTIGSTTNAEEFDLKNKTPQKQIIKFTGDEYDLVFTSGQIEKLLRVTEINWIEGDSELVEEIKRLLDPTYSLKNACFKIIECSNLSFSITYNWELIYRPLYRFSFFTAMVDSERFFLTYFIKSLPYNCRNHTVIVEGFNGELMVIRYFSPIKILNPIGDFMFNGEFEEVTIIK